MPDMESQSEEMRSTAMSGTQNVEASITPSSPDLTITDENPQPIVPEFVIDPAQSFNEEFTKYSALSPEALQYAFDRLQSSYPNMSPEDISALLLASEGRIADEQIQPLRETVLKDAVSADLYFSERFKRIDITQLQTEITSLDTALQNASDLNPNQLHQLVETITLRTNELEPLLASNPELQAAVTRIEQEWQVREQKVANLAQASQEAVGLINPDHIPSDSEITEVERSGNDLTVTIQNADGSSEQKIVKEQNIWTLLLITGVSDLLLGTNNLGKLAEIWMGNNVLGPVLAKMGIDGAEFSKHFNSKNFEPFDGMLKVMDNPACKKYFEDAVQKNFLYDVLKQTNPDHIQKIFNPDGTQAFGSSGIFDSDHLRLDQDLVQQLYDSLSETEREELKIPPRKEAKS